jgi:FkbM family methyltransferase
MIASLLPLKLKNLIKSALLKRSVWSSQAGQDFWIYGECFNFKANGFFLDIGAHDGIHISNTYLLEKIFHWKGICIEANPTTFRSLSRNRNCKTVNVAIAHKEGTALFKPDGVMGGFVGDTFDNREDISSNCIEVPTVTLNSLLHREQAPTIIDYMSVDVEGAEDAIFSGFDLNTYRCNTLTIERPSSNLREHLKRNKYLLVRDIPGLDAFYIHEYFKDEYVNNMFKFWDRKFLSYQWTSHKKTNKSTLIDL